MCVGEVAVGGWAPASPLVTVWGWGELVASVNAGLLHNPKSFSVSLHSISFVKVVKVIVQASNLPLFTRRPKIVT